MNPALPAPRALDAAERRALLEDGYLLLPAAVPRALVDGALAAINGSLGELGIAKDELPTFRARTFTPELTTHPALTALFFASGLGAAAHGALGAGNLRPPREAQIALRFPVPPPGAPPGPHIDGIAYPGNGVPPGVLLHFTALGAVFLSAVDGPDQGNFTVWPGSHRLIEAHFRQHGPRGIVDRFPDLPLPAPRQITARPGDALLAHYALAHGIAPNTGPNIRYAVFFRLRHDRHEAFGEGPLSDLWLEWEGVRAPGL